MLIKDNHIAAAGGIANALGQVRERIGHMVKVEIEVDTLEQLADVLTYDVDAVLLDNMPPEVLREAVSLIEGRVIAEASGDIRLDNVRAIAETGVDLVSLGWITHSAPSLNVSLDFVAP